ncbi:MAG TPA: CPBP family intramembrane glutamic endopeptidase [Hyphomicrobiaceae bacterium]|nr:CPBP family intramembrane glutamic endopeptidase [Hyphomicrobiaceae bacterium]
MGASILGAGLALGLNLDATFNMPGRMQPASQDRAALATLAIWQGITVILTLVASSLFGGKARDVLALRGAVGSPSVYPKAIALLFALQFGVSIVQYFLIPTDMFTDLRPFVQFVSGSDWLLALMVVGVGAPLSEELLFRGFLLSALAQSRVGFWGAAFIVSGLWTALHVGYSLAGVIEVFLIGIYFSWLLWRTGSLRVALFCHALYNSLIVLVLRHVPLPA